MSLAIKFILIKIMAENTKIEWCNHTVNLWWGCSKVHTGCKNCYAEYFSDVRYKNNLWGVNTKRRRIKSAFSDLDKYQRQAKEQGVKMTVFIGSMMDIFEEDKELENPICHFTSIDELRKQLFNNISDKKYENLIFLFLTKRPENIQKFIPISWYHDNILLGNASPNNILFGVSISDQETANKLVPMLIMNTPLCAKKFISIEPQVGEIDLYEMRYNTKVGDENVSFILTPAIDWIIQGGESGTKKRPFNLDWAYKIKSQCLAENIPYFFKQIDKIKEIPLDLQIQELPKF